MLISIIEGDEIQSRSLSNYLENRGYRTEIYLTGEKALHSIERTTPDLIVIDTVLPDGDGMAIFKKINEHHASIPVVVITGSGNVRSSVEAMKIGALDYLVKPIDYDELSGIIKKGMIRFQQRTRKSILDEQRKNRFHFSNLIGSSPIFQKAIDVAKRISASPVTTILLQGESGTGKDLFCKAIHYNSNRSKHALVEINCSAIPDTLLESELFGHEPGAFTGADRVKKGLFEIADTGTLFLDEIGDMPLNLQSKLIKAIEDRKFRRVGGSEELYCNARIIAATNKDLLKEVQVKTFRHDLYYRLRVACLTLPTLRSRGYDDIMLLIQYFISHFAKEYAIEQPALTDPALNLMTGYSWPGNVRQLKNAIERAMMLVNDGPIRPEDLQLEEERVQPETSLNPGHFEIPEKGFNLDRFNASLIIQALRKANGNKTKAAEYLGISRDTFRYRLKAAFLNRDKDAQDG
ncbi:sigma-54-dependent Fis family transcriptional regulator [bacterium]|nr:sigma-54-dependent Fis family transcriptional regulator [candidate division CSSED10-310 bacterium]